MNEDKKMSFGCFNYFFKWAHDFSEKNPNKDTSMKVTACDVAVLENGVYSGLAKTENNDPQ